VAGAHAVIWLEYNRTSRVNRKCTTHLPKTQNIIVELTDEINICTYKIN
jgi:hypothetical protein